jgi:hypothetical protein
MVQVQCKFTAAKAKKEDIGMVSLVDSERRRGSSKGDSGCTPALSL